MLFAILIHVLNDAQILSVRFYPISISYVDPSLTAKAEVCRRTLPSVVVLSECVRVAYLSLLSANSAQPRRFIATVHGHIA